VKICRICICRIKCNKNDDIVHLAIWMRPFCELTRSALPGDIFSFLVPRNSHLNKFFLKKKIKKKMEATIIMSHNNLLKCDEAPAVRCCHSVEVGYGVRVVDEHTTSIFRFRVSHMIFLKCMYSVPYV